MHEYVTVSSSSYDPAALASKLTDKSSEGWDVVSIVQTGGDVTAFLRRSTDGAAPAAPAAAAVVVEAVPDAVVVPTPAPEPVVVVPAAVQEPAGWAATPEPTPEPTPQPITEAIPATVYAPDPTPAAAPVAAVVHEPVAAVAPEPVASTPAVPAGWYADPSGRFELRYWDGGAWTEHVARGGQQFTDPPVA